MGREDSDDEKPRRSDRDVCLGVTSSLTHRLFIIVLFNFLNLGNF